MGLIFFINNYYFIIFIKMNNDIYKTDEKQKIILKDEEISPINPKILFLTENNELELINNSSNSIKEEIKSEISIKTSSVVNSTTSSFYSVSKAPIVTCKRHGQVFIGVDTSKFRLTCKKCNELKIKSELDFVEETDNSLPEDKEITCTNHILENGSFFCLDCKVFICKECLMGSHKKHSSNLPSYLSNTFKEDVSKIIKELDLVKPKIDASLEAINQMNTKIKKISTATSDRMKLAVENIGRVHKNKVESKYKDFDTIFGGLDLDLESVNSRTLAMKARINKFLFELNELEKFLNDRDKELNDLQICDLLEKKGEMFLEIKKLKDSNKFIMNHTPNLLNQIKQKIENFDKEIISRKKTLHQYYNSITSSLNSGTTSSSLSKLNFYF